MSDGMMGYVFFFGFWIAGIICCAAAIFAVFVVIRSIRQNRED